MGAGIPRTCTNPQLMLQDLVGADNTGGVPELRAWGTWSQRASKRDSSAIRPGAVPCSKAKR